MTRAAIGLDVGGTKIAAGAVAADGQIIRRLTTPTPHDDGAAVVDALLRLIDELRDEHPGIDSIGVGAAGMVAWPSGQIIWAPNNAYRRLPLRELLTERTGLPAVVDNDANAAAWAEARIGAGAGHDDVVVLTIGTGIGGGLVQGGALIRGSTGGAGEVGHVIVNPTGRYVCGCGAIGCVETMASGRALARLGQAAAAADPDGRLATLARARRTTITGEMVFEAARLGDATAVGLFDELGFWLGVGVANVVAVLDPELVVLGGGLAETGDLLLTPTQASYERFAHARRHRTLPPLLPARLGTDAGLVGAALLALDGCPAVPV